MNSATVPRLQISSTTLVDVRRKQHALYYDGNRIASQAGAGTTTQDITDDVTNRRDEPDRTGTHVGDRIRRGYVARFDRLSDSVRYRGNAMRVPVREFASHSHMIALVDFDDNTPAGFVVVEQEVNTRPPPKPG